MNLPNKLTVSRFVLTIAFLAVMFSQVKYHQTIALVLFAAGGISDFLDGTIARRRKLITNFGILMDPLADKIMVCSAFIAFAGEKGDGGGFNGIGVRWIARFTKDRGEQAAFEPWLQKNAGAAWQARRSSDNLVWCRWPQPTPEDRRYSWGCSSAVVLLQVVRPPEPGKP